MVNGEYAGFWIRVAASLIDTVVFVLVFSLPLTIIYGTEYWITGELVLGVWDFLLTHLIPIAITVWFCIPYLGTPGKMALRLQVLDAHTGQAISTPKAVSRYFGNYLSAIPLLLCLIGVGIDKKKQGLHDKLAGTVVVRSLAK